MTGTGDPTLSIITVVLNGEDTICDTVQSVARQSYGSIEHIVKDGGSSDNTVALAASCMGGRGKLVSSPDSGIYDAMNQALALCTGDLVLFLNVGDILFSDSIIEEFVRHHYRGPAHIYLCAVATKDRGIRRPRWVWLKRHYMLPACHQGIIYPAAVFADHKYSPRYRIVGDFEHFLRVARATRITVADLVLSVFDADGVSTVNRAAMNREFRMVYDDMAVNPVFRMLKAAHELHDILRPRRGAPPS